MHTTCIASSAQMSSRTRNYSILEYWIWLTFLPVYRYLRHTVIYWNKMDTTPISTWTPVDFTFFSTSLFSLTTYNMNNVHPYWQIDSSLLRQYVPTYNITSLANALQAYLHDMRYRHTYTICFTGIYTTYVLYAGIYTKYALQAYIQDKFLQFILQAPHYKVHTQMCSHVMIEDCTTRTSR